TNEYCAVLVEGIQGVGGIYVPSPEFLREARRLCTETGTLLIMDEIQSGYGRSGRFFAHQHAGIEADLITIAKGMGNGYPIGGVLISPEIKPWHGMLGTTFGGNHLACAAALAVLEVIEQEGLIAHAETLGAYISQKLGTMSGITDLRGQGLMIGIELPGPYAPVRDRLLYESGIFVGTASTNVLRLLPPLCLTQDEADRFLAALASYI
ncbi:MAG: aminotransferase class III-fold pyridoxal phosphate-dependent enzyme, partial [Bacteroidetes bacterium]